MPQPSRGLSLPDVVSLNLPEDLHPDPEKTGSHVTTVLCRLSFKKIHP